MPLITDSDYKVPFLFRNAHVNTIYPALCRPPAPLNFERERITTKDNDFIDLDWSKKDGDRLVVCLHGLEGDATRPYIRGMLSYFNRQGWAGVGVNFRSCSGPMNKGLRMYNMGATADLHLIVKHLIAKGYKKIALVGFSLGGNMLLKYMGEGGKQLPKQIAAAVAISVPCYIPTANVKIDQIENRAYLIRFLRTLIAKMKVKNEAFPNHIKIPKKWPKNFQELDAAFTAPTHGYANAMDYWENCSSLHFLPNISRPSLLINAIDDTFLSPECYPFDLAKEHPHFYFETPAYGGHCGFYTKSKNNVYWTEKRALAFIEQWV